MKVELANKNITIVIVAWNTRDFLKQCLRSVHESKKAFPFEIIVVDNASTDGTPEMVQTEFPDVELIENDQNLGFARANNIALRKILESKISNYVLLLNSDTIIPERSIERMAQYLENNPQIGAAAPSLVLPDGRLQIGPTGYLPSLFTGITYFSFLSKLLPHVCRGLFVDPQSSAKKRTGIRVDWLSGACLMLRRDTIEKVGLMDEDYFFYLDDVDWGRRMIRSGIVLHYLPWIRITHYHGVTYKHVIKDINTKWLLMIYHDVYKEKGQTEYFCFRLFSAYGFFLRFCLHAISHLFKGSSMSAEKMKENFRFFTFSLTVKKNHVINPYQAKIETNIDIFYE